MIYVLIPMAVLAGAGIGFGYGIHFARQDQSAVFALMTSTVDKLTTSALFPGLKGVLPQEPVEDRMFDAAEDDGPNLPPYLREEEDNPWDYSETVPLKVDG